MGDPVTRIVAASGPIRFGKGCNDVDYSFPSTAVALVVLEWVRLTPHLPLRPQRFTPKTLPVRAPPAIECFSGPGGSVQFMDHGRRFAAFLLLSRRASPELANQARAVLGTLRVTAARGACTADTTKAVVRSFVRGYNSGQVSAINRLFAPEPRFMWFSTGPPGARLGPRAYGRATLVAYLRTRVRVHERIRVTQLGAGYDPKRKIVNFGGKLIRSADDLRPSLRDFKGAADCVSGRPSLIVWSM